MKSTCRSNAADKETLELHQIVCLASLLYMKQDLDRPFERAQNHRMAWVGRDLKDGLVPTLLLWAAAQAAQWPIQAGTEHLQGWDIHSFPSFSPTLWNCANTYVDCGVKTKINNLSFIRIVHVADDAGVV